MAYQQTPQSLADIYNGPVGAFVPGMQLWDQQGQRDQLTQADQQRQLDYNMQADPHRLQQMGLANQTTEAQLPGVLANSSMLQRKDRMGADSYDAELKSLLGKHKADDIGNYVKEMEGLGSLALTHAAAAGAEPFGAADRIRKAFGDAGHGDFWNSEWDNMPVDQLAGKLQLFGTKVQESSAGYKKALDAVQARADSAKEIAELKAKTDLEKTRLMGEFKNNVERLKAEAKKAGPVGLEKAGQALLSQAQVETDPERSSHLREQARELLDEAARIKAAGAMVTQGGAVDVNALGKPGGGISSRGTGAVVPPRPDTPKPKVQFEEGKVYQDANGNKAKYVNGQWVSI